MLASTTRTLEWTRIASRNASRCAGGALASTAVATSLVLSGCGGGSGGIGGNGLDPNVVAFQFSEVTPLLSAHVDDIVQAAAEATDDPNLAIAVVDRVGNILRTYRRGANGAAIGALTDEQRFDLAAATSIARAAAYLSHSQAPLTSRTGQFLATFHTPAVFSQTDYVFDPPDVFPLQSIPIQRTLGVENTSQADLWQIDASNRGTTFESAATNPPTAYVPGNELPILANPDGTVPSPGLGPLPGGVPLYIRSANIAPDDTVPRRLVGSIGVYTTLADGVTPNPELAEFAAQQGALAINDDTGENFTFGPNAVPNEGGVFLVGILLPFLFQDVPQGIVPGVFDPNDQVAAVGELPDGTVDPEGYVIAPQASAAAGGLTAAEVDTIIQACRDASRDTHAAIRLPAESACKMWISVCDADGVLLGVFRQVDATLFSYEISLTKARNAAYYSNPASVNGPDAGPLAGLHPLTGFRALPDGDGGFLPLVDEFGAIIPGNGTIVDIFPPNRLTTTGVATTARTLGFLTQPFYPPNIDDSPDAGPLNFLVQKNRNPASFQLQGFNETPAQPDTESGIIFFPGSAPLYRDGVLIGGLGVSGDGVSQDDVVTALGIMRAETGFTDDDGTVFPPIGFDLEPDEAIKSSSFAFENVAIPYMKFPQNPNG